MRTLESERLVLRPLKPGDADSYRRIGDGMTPEKARSEVEDAVAPWREHGFGPWAELEREGGDFVGVLEIHHAGAGLEGIAPDEIEIGWSVDPAARRRGIATEAARALVRDAFDRLGVERLVAYVRLWNIPSLRIVERLGMRDEGRGLTRSGEPMRIFRLPRADYDRST